MEERIVITCTTRDLSKDDNGVVNFSIVEAKIEILELEGERLGVLRGATMSATGDSLESAQAHAIKLAKSELGL